MSEIQPHLVTKLTEGRAKRIKAIEGTYKVKLKDVDQRSAETNVGNSNHLEMFQQKAITNSKQAEQMTKDSIDALFTLLQISIPSIAIK